MRQGLVFLILCLVGLAACGLLGSGDEDRPDIPGRIVFSAKDKAGNSQVYTMRANGTGLKQLTNFEHNGAYEPSWSPDGTRIAFSSSYGATTLGPSLYVMDADGSNMRPLKRLPQESPKVLVGSAPAWSPDGSQIAFTSDRNYVKADTMRYRTDLYVMNADGTNLQRLTETGNATRPSWSPDGINIAYERNIHGNAVFIYHIASDQVSMANRIGLCRRRNVGP